MLVPGQISSPLVKSMLSVKFTPSHRAGISYLPSQDEAEDIALTFSFASPLSSHVSH